MKGLGLTGVGFGGDGVERNIMYDSNLARKDDWAVETVLVGSGGLDTEGLAAGGVLRLRGRGGGMVGRRSYMCVSSASVGIGVVRALGRKQMLLSFKGWIIKRAHLTTTIEKSGWGGAVLR